MVNVRDLLRTKPAELWTVAPNAAIRAAIRRGSPDVAALGENFLVTATQSALYPQYRFPVAKRVSGAGAVLDANEIALGNSFARFGGCPAIGFS